MPPTSCPSNDVHRFHKHLMNLGRRADEMCDMGRRWICGHVASFYLSCFLVSHHSTLRMTKLCTSSSVPVHTASKILYGTWSVMSTSRLPHMPACSIHSSSCHVEQGQCGLGLTSDMTHAKLPDQPAVRQRWQSHSSSRTSAPPLVMIRADHGTLLQQHRLCPSEHQPCPAATCLAVPSPCTLH